MKGTKALAIMDLLYFPADLVKKTRALEEKVGNTVKIQFSIHFC
jgi:hypothetical protein